jgi:hypothetical protein
VLKSSFIDSKSELQSPNSSSDAINEISSAPDNTVTVSKSRYTPTEPHVKHVSCELDYCNGSGDSNFLDIDWLSSSDNERPTTISTPDVNASADSVSAGVSSRRTVSAFNNSTVHFLFMCIAITVQKPQPFLYGVIP